jgi:eukaryotic-like serine/threonine-protein kinase
VPVPKVIDFGIAKATQGRLTDHTLFTAFEQFIGTPAYMSPEQAVMTSLDIDTRSDIYSLGVLLYELLTGRTPFDQKELLAAGLDEMRRTIREVEPVKPSTRLTQELVAAPRQSAADSSGENGGALPRRRYGETQELIHVLRGDLDWIVMKCLEKDRARRYETANGLGADIQRHLNNEPVIACPPSRVYRFQKSVQRNKLAFAAASAVVAALVIGLTIATVMFFRERATYRRALVAERRAEQSRGEEVSLQLRILDIMDEMEHHGPDTEADKLLTEGMNWAIASKAQRAQVLQLRATIFARRGRWNEAAADFKNSLEADPETTYQSAWRCYLVGTILAQCNQLDAYREHCRKSLQRFRTTTDPVSAERIAKVCLLSSSAGVDLEAVARMTDTATNQMYVAWAHLAKGLAEYRQGHFVSAGQWVQETLDDNLGGSDRDHRFVEAYMVLAMANYQLRQMDNARAAFTKGVQIEQTKLAKIESGDLSPDWMDWIITQTLMREAKALIEGQPANATEMKSEPR